MSLASGLPICSICYNEILSANSIKINGCDHEFHKDCLRSSALASVGEHQIPVPCPQCKADRIFMRILGKDQSKFTVEVILDHQLANVFTEEDWNQYYLTSLRVATGNQLVACPNVNCGCEYLVENEEELKCDTTTSSNSSEQSSKESEKSATFLKCVQCKWKWCRACGVPDWHFGKTCKEVAEQTEQVKKQHEAFEKLFDENRRYVRCPNADCNTVKSLKLFDLFVIRFLYEILISLFSAIGTKRRLQSHPMQNVPTSLLHTRKYSRFAFAFQPTTKELTKYL
ncbi:hypothetical protein HK098_003035 [Nowakowskiella sp. JEL0407]|nr:hypothetical protein HK098_003035 [Nowakowskiella sp. JEL0407]